MYTGISNMIFYDNTLEAHSFLLYIYICYICIASMWHIISAMEPHLEECSEHEIGIENQSDEQVTETF